MTPKNTLLQSLKNSAWYSPLLWVVASTVVIMASWGIVKKPGETWFLLAGVMVYLVAILRPLWLLYAVLLLPVAGEFGRVTAGPAAGNLLSDIGIPILCTGWLTALITRKKLPSDSTAPRSLPIPILKALTFFALAGAFSLLGALAFLQPQEVAQSSLYLIRYIFYVSLCFVAFHNISSEKAAKNITVVMGVSTVLIALAGFVQLALYPDMEPLEAQGWDPHKNRLVSTWLDPNFVGGLFAFIGSLLLGISLHTPKWSRKLGLWGVLAVLAVAILFTYSRSAWLAAATGFFVISLLKSRKILVILLITLLLGVTVSDRARERATDFMTSAGAVLGLSTHTPDPTARLRLESWQQSWQLFTMRPIAGSGFNTLRFVNHREGFVENTQVHSASGSDSTLLTVLATTGLLGIVPFLFLHFFPLKKAWQLWRDKKRAPFQRGFALGFLGGLMALLVHSVFLNSLLFAPILIFLWCSAGTLLGLEADKHPAPKTLPKKRG